MTASMRSTLGNSRRTTSEGNTSSMCTRHCEYLDPLTTAPSVVLILLSLPGTEPSFCWRSKGGWSASTDSSSSKTLATRTSRTRCPTSACAPCPPCSEAQFPPSSMPSCERVATLASSDFSARVWCSSVSCALSRPTRAPLIILSLCSLRQTMRTPVRLA